MAKLPPKSPTSNCLPPSAVPPAFWATEFLEFSGARRNSHRRSVSDPVSFGEIDEDCPTIVMPCSSNNNNNNNNNNRNIEFEFEHLDDEQLSSMFSEDDDVVLPPPSNPSTLPDQSCDNDSNNNINNTIKLKKQEEAGEVESQYHLSQKPPSSSGTIIVDPKRVKRILANRQSARRSRARKLHYISELERSVTSLLGVVSSLSPRVAFLDNQRLKLSMDNNALKQRIAALLQDKLFKQAHQEALRKEVERLRKLYHQQKLNKTMDDNSNQCLQ